MTSSSTPTTVAAPTATASLWSPLSLTVFRLLWIALLTENICTWLLDVTNGWLMTSISPSPVMVSLVQTASLLPILVLALPSGALTDILNRRTILLSVEATLAIVNAVLAALVYLQLLTGPSLLVFIFINGVALAFGTPVWQTVTAEVVPVAQQPAAYLVGNVAVNMARAVGPVLAGVFLATAGGPTVSYAVTAIGFGIAFLTVRRWPITLPTAAYLQPERVLTAAIAGIRYIRYERTIRVALVRVLAFVPFATAFWAVAPLVGRGMIGLNALGYGLWMAAFGTGAILGGYVMNKLVASVNLDVIVAVNTLGMAMAIAAIALYPVAAVAFPVMFIVGIVWAMTLSAFMMSVQTNVPSWVRGRAIAIYFMVFQGGIALAAAAWGLVAQRSGIQLALLAAASGLLLSLLAGIRWKLTLGDSSTLSPYGVFPLVEIPALLDTTEPEVLVVFEYSIREADRNAFLGLMKSVSAIRQRNGVSRWGLYEDVTQPGHWREEFVVDSLAEMERTRQRTTTADYAILQQAYALHQGPGDTPTITRLVAPSTI